MAKRKLEKHGENWMARLMICVLASLSTMYWVLPAVADESGTRLRVTERGAVSRVGTFGGLRGDTLLLVGSDGAPRAIAFPAIEKVEKSRGRQGHSLAGAGIGLCTGAIAGGILGSYFQPREGTTLSFAAAGAVYLGLAGALLGAAAGAGWKSEKWRRIPMKELQLEMGLNESGAPQLILVRRF